MKKRNLSLSSLIFILFITSITNSLSEVKNIIKGKAKVIDGDTIKIEEKKIRLFGIDAPEINQTCGKKN
jgi:endonuclease YncB( thermonuclease family)